MKTMYKKHIRPSIALSTAILFGIASGCNGHRQANHFLFNSFKKKNNKFEDEFKYKKVIPPIKPSRSQPISWNEQPSNPEGNSVVMETRATIPAKIKGIWVLGEDADCTSCLLVVDRQGEASIKSKADNPDNPDSRVGFLFSIPKRKLIPAFWTMLDQTIQVAEHYKPGTPCNCVKIALQDDRLELEIEVSGSLVDTLIKQAKKLDYREVVSDPQQLTGWTHFDTSTRIESFERTNTSCGRGAELGGFLGSNALKKEDRLSLILAKERDPFAFVQSVRKGFFQSTKCVTHIQGHIVCPVSNKHKGGAISVTVDKKDLDGTVLLKEYPITYGCVQKDTYRVASKGLRKVTHVSLFELKPTAKKRKFLNRSTATATAPYKEHIYDIPYANNSGIPYKFNHKTF